MLGGDDATRDGYTLRIGHGGALYVPTSKGIYVWEKEAWRCLTATAGKHFVGMAIHADKESGEDHIVAFTDRTSDMWRSRDSGESREQLSYGNVDVDQQFAAALEVCLCQAGGRSVQPPRERSRCGKYSAMVRSPQPVVSLRSTAPIGHLPSIPHVPAAEPHLSNIARPSPPAPRNVTAHP